ncbi:60S ACIDIC ribosomal protein P0 [Anaeramoeba flamelloides]|uniref:60S ACIDIC ribosomal protein P0 n=1 Tax=Anaeramoeba flamelloides TaxID=1746091 RepID=A0AAV7ZLM8_9EUKA|nr:60S ACIDIC ribosomal protein P0 [Anaeramoeba flamelloides]
MINKKELIQKQKDYKTTLLSSLRSHSTGILFPNQNLNSDSIQKIRSYCKEIGEIFCTNNIDFQTTLKHFASENTGFQDLLGFVNDHQYLILLDLNPKIIKKIGLVKVKIELNKGETSPQDFILKRGPTTISQDYTRLFLECSIPVAHHYQKIYIPNDTIIVKKGETINEQKFELLELLDLDLQQNLKNKVQFFYHGNHASMSIINASDQLFKKMFNESFYEVYYISKILGYPIQPTMKFLFNTTLSEICSISVELNYKIKITEHILLQKREHERKIQLQREKQDLECSSSDGYTGEFINFFENF